MTDQQPWLYQRCSEQVGGFPMHHTLELSAMWTVVFGPSGTGKSTWLRMLAGLLPQRTGSLRLQGDEIRELPPYRRRVAMVEQSPALFPHRNVEQNVAFALRSNQSSPTELEVLLEDFQLTTLRKRRIHTLSGGERQRVAIARALCSHPRALLLDEVLTGMDAALRADLSATVQRYSSRLRLPVISVTHDIGEVFATAEHVLRMRAGRFLAQGTPAEVLRPERENLLRHLSTLA